MVLGKLSQLAGDLLADAPGTRTVTTDVIVPADGGVGLRPVVRLAGAGAP
jgi:hypothetical protein